MKVTVYFIDTAQTPLVIDNVADFDQPTFTEDDVLRITYTGGKFLFDAGLVAYVKVED